ncbi:MAG: exodeoxyribonuclease VII small subunit [Candidatus Omnitrophica bacterium]|jgi:exodeoxyribonuclease VII small subunit|nr:exodeoxyribonuclease VII small subunit [Candidatus Omnitrophota bacterium]MDD5080051.1 exodeoxyribonuclease VII small subunit [Candidatus Omnitrophota bacterium]
MPEIKFEEALKKLEKIVDELENGELSLDDALKKYQEGLELSRQCSQRLDSAKKKIDILVKNKKGEFELKGLDEAEIKE